MSKRNIKAHLWKQGWVLLFVEQPLKKSILKLLPKVEKTVKAETGKMVSFIANRNTIIASKMDFMSDGGSFLYYRKGEAEGALEVAAYAVRILQTVISSSLETPSITEAAKIVATITAGGGVALAGLTAINKLWAHALKQCDTFLDNLDKSKKLHHRVISRLNIDKKGRIVKQVQFPLPRDIRILCHRGGENAQAIPILRALGARIRHRPQEISSGTHRFHVNDSRFCLFIHSKNDEWFGVTGNDNMLQEKLRAEFLAEWEKFGPDVSC